MKLQLIGTTLLKKKGVPLYRMAKYLFLNADHVEPMGFSHPPELTEEEIIKDIPQMLAKIIEHHANLIADGYKWHVYEQKWHK